MNIRKEVERIKDMYPAGTRIELLQTMDDIQGVEAGSKGTVTRVDDLGTIHMRWDNGRGLGLIPGEDSFKVLSKPQEGIEKVDEHSADESQGMGGMNL